MVAQYLIKLLKKDKVSARKFIFASCNYRWKDSRILMWILWNKIC